MIHLLPSIYCWWWKDCNPEYVTLRISWQRAEDCPWIRSNIRTKFKGKGVDRGSGGKHSREVRDYLRLNSGVSIIFIIWVFYKAWFERIEFFIVWPFAVFHKMQIVFNKKKCVFHVFQIFMKDKQCFCQMWSLNQQNTEVNTLISCVASI